VDVIAFRPDRSLPEPAYRQLAGYLRGLIEAGRLAPGEKLPASRELAAALRLSRNTVTLAYQALLDADLLRARVGQGTFVADAPAARAASPRRLAPAPRAFAWEGLFAARAGAVRPLAPGRARGSARFDFRPGRVDARALAQPSLKRAFAAAFAELPRFANAHDPRGFAPLREAIAQRLLSRGIACDAGQVVVTAGAQQALHLVAGLLLDPGDFAAIEEPGYFGAAWALRAAQAHALPIPADAEGLRTDLLARVLRTRRVKLVYATPAVQCPTGVTLSEARRGELLALAEAHQMPVLEDDYDGEMRHGGALVPALAARDAAGQVICVGTFSKAAFPALRLAWVVAAPAFAQRLAQAKLASDFGTPTLGQAALAHWIASGGFDRHVRRTRGQLAERMEAASDALACELPEARFPRPAGGHTLWLTLPEDVDAARLLVAAREAELAFDTGEAFFLDGGGERNLFLSVANLAPGELREGIARLAECVHASRGAAPARDAREEAG
jgi:GntR family transcriptional regulator/MocR family aminotransferase